MILWDFLVLMAIEGIVVNVSGNQVMISYQNEEDHEVVETYNIDDVDVV